MKKYSSLLFILFFFQSFSQKPVQLNSSEIYQALEKLNFLGTVLYVAAHPDDENQRIISYFSNAVHANTAYLSMTRGDGGQNLIGPEIREELGVIRTQELLAARRIDGGQQFFTRANDFGYSKHPDETFAIWNKEEVLSDVVWTIRRFKPDIIINRFDHRTPGTNHGHHTASAMLSIEALDKSDKTDIYPEQLQYTDPWKVKRIFFNSGWWFYGSRENFEKADKSNLLSVDIGTYFPLLGKSNTEIAAEARSMHKCQGFGSSGSRGTQMEYLEIVAGDAPKEMKDPFEGINTSWTRVKGGEKIANELAQIMDDYDFNEPSKSVPALLQLKRQISSLENEHWKKIKIGELENIIAQCLGLFVEIAANSPSASPGSSLNCQLEITNRSNLPVKVKSISIQPGMIDTISDAVLVNNQKQSQNFSLNIPTDFKSSSPYWLNNDAELGMYSVPNQLLRGTPENKRPITAEVVFEIQGMEYGIETDLIYKKNDPVNGEMYQPFEIVPSFSVSLTEDVYIFSDEQSKTVEVIVKANQDNARGSLELCHGENWQSVPAKHSVNIEKKGAEQRFKFELTPPSTQDDNMIVPLLRDENGMSYTNATEVISYDHIPTQTIVSDASAKSVKIDINKAGNRIAYLMGAGDKIPESLRQIGYEVDVLEISEINADKLAQYDAFIVGIRAYNVLDRIGFHQDEFLKYVENGGTMIVQYNTSRRLKVEQLGPYPFQLSRDRVTDEFAEVRIIKPDHEVFHFPNKISSSDFEGWVQERGLYFPNEWSKEYEAPLSTNDPGESPKNGSLLIAKYGSGYYIYSGLSWFRELPAGVPGAYRLFANLISIGKYDKP